MQSPVVTFGPNLGIPNGWRRSNFTARRPSNIWWRQNFVPVVPSYFSIVLIFIDILLRFYYGFTMFYPWFPGTFAMNFMGTHRCQLRWAPKQQSKQSKQVADHAQRIKNLVRAYNQVLQEESTLADRLFGSGEVSIGFEGSPTYPNMDGLEMFRTAQEWIVDKSVNFSNLGFLEQIMKIPSMFW